jgi:tRNA-2-methylthio-N6-dimethylallyladenosine synthase
MSGRARDNRLVHFTPDALPNSAGAPRPGDIVTVTVTRGAPHYLLSDATPLSVRRTPAGDAWEAAATAPLSPASAAPVSAAPVSAAPVSAGPVSAAAPVLLGMPARHPAG